MTLFCNPNQQKRDWFCKWVSGIKFCAIIPFENLFEARLLIYCVKLEMGWCYIPIYLVIIVFYDLEMQLIIQSLNSEVCSMKWRGYSQSLIMIVELCLAGDPLRHSRVEEAPPSNFFYFKIRRDHGKHLLWAPRLWVGKR